MARVEQLGAPVGDHPIETRPRARATVQGTASIWIKDPDGYTVVLASPDGEAFEPG